MMVANSWLFCCSIANILDGVMRAAERQSHMGSMKVSVTTALSVMAVTADKWSPGCHYIVFWVYQDEKAHVNFFGWVLQNVVYWELVKQFSDSNANVGLYVSNRMMCKAEPEMGFCHCTVSCAILCLRVLPGLQYGFWPLSRNHSLYWLLFVPSCWAAGHTVGWEQEGSLKHAGRGKISRS